VVFVCVSFRLIVCAFVFLKIYNYNVWYTSILFVVVDFSSPLSYQSTYQPIEFNNNIKKKPISPSLLFFLFASDAIYCLINIQTRTCIIVKLVHINFIRLLPYVRCTTYNIIFVSYTCLVFGRPANHRSNINRAQVIIVVTTIERRQR
jgi:hypothetical protein